MPNLCCVQCCQTAQETREKKVQLFRLPSSKDEPEKRQSWIDALVKFNGNFPVSDHTVVCEKHWPQGYKRHRKKYSKYETPVDPPSVFGEVPISDEEMKHARILSNILLNNLCKSTTPRDSKESSLKLLKLSD